MITSFGQIPRDAIVRAATLVNGRATFSDTAVRFPCRLHRVGSGSPLSERLTRNQAGQHRTTHVAWVNADWQEQIPGPTTSSGRRLRIGTQQFHIVEVGGAVTAGQPVEVHLSEIPEALT